MNKNKTIPDKLGAIMQDLEKKNVINLDNSNSEGTHDNH